MSSICKALIRKRGDTVYVLPRVETVDSDGHAIYSYTSTIETKALMASASGIREDWLIVGVQNPYDALAMFYPKESINAGDLIKCLDGSLYEVDQVIPRRVGSQLYYQETLLRRRRDTFNV